MDLEEKTFIYVSGGVDGLASLPNRVLALLRQARNEHGRSYREEKIVSIQGNDRVYLWNKTVNERCARLN